MCSNKSIPSMNKKRRRPKSRKSRAKGKKPKFLSLRLQFPADETGTDKCFSTEDKRHTGDISTAVAVAAAAVTTFSAPATDSHQLNLFPLHPENQLQDRENHDQENVAYFFSAADGGATTLTGLLDDSTTTTTGSMSSHGTNNSSRQEDLSPSSASLTYAYGGHECKDGAALVRNAMRNRERDSSEEKWVCYSEVVERKVKEEEVTSSAVDLRITEDRGGIQRLCLKLDYQEILNAWCNKGPLYVDAESSQIVPDMTSDFFSNESCYNGLGWGLWTVPEMVGDIDDNGEMIMKNREEELMKLGQREASVLRYKEKRHNRLFSKKIRYQVRKLNAEKRPRLKGRFVKRS